MTMISLVDVLKMEESMTDEGGRYVDAVYEGYVEDEQWLKRDYTYRYDHEHVIEDYDWDSLRPHMKFW